MSSHHNSSQLSNLQLKTTLLTLNKSREISINKFFEKTLTKYGFKTHMTIFKRSFLKFFSSTSFTSDQLDKLIVSFQSSTTQSQSPSESSSSPLSSNSIINIIDLLLFIYKIIELKLMHPYFVLFHVANILDIKYKCTTIDFLTINSLSIEQEININLFQFKIAQPLQLSEFEALILFKALNINNNGTISMLDFVKLIDSYRNDYESASRIITDEMNITITNRNFAFIGKYCSLCIEKNIAEIDMFKSCLKKRDNENEDKNAEIEVNDECKIALEIFEEALKIEFKEVSIEEEINGIVEAFTINNKGEITFKEYRALLSFYNYEVIFSNNQLNFTCKSKSSIKTSGKSLPLKDNKAALDQLYNEILKMMTKSSKQRNNNNNQYKKHAQSLEKNKAQRNNDLNTSVRLPLLNSQNEQDLPKEMLTNIITNGLEKWRLIELLEEIKTPNNNIYLTSFDLLSLLKKEFTDIPKDKQLFILNLIDYNKDGYISINDLSVFLLNYFNHKSTKLGWRIVKETLNERQIPIEEFVQKLPNEIVECGQLNQLFITEFNLEKIIVADMYENLLNVIIKKYQRNIIKTDIIEQVNSQSKTYNSPIKNRNKRPTLTISHSIDCSKDNKIIKDDLMRILNGFLTINHLFQFINLPNQISLYEYRELFLKKYSINYIKGINIFYSLKDNNTGLLSQDALKEFLKTIISDKDDKKIKFNMKTLIQLIDVQSNYIVLCFETYPFTSSFISIIELFNHIKKFLPHLNHILLMSIIQLIDNGNKGIVTYKSLCDFLYKYSKVKYSCDLMLKSIVAYLDNEQYNTDSYISQDILLSPNDKLTMEETNNLFINRLKFNKFQQEFFINTGMSVEELTITIKSLRQNEYYIYCNKAQKEGCNIGIITGIGEINYNDIDKYLYININLQVTIVDIFNYLKGKIHDSNKDKPNILKKIFLYLKGNDTNQTGTISYDKLYHLLEWQNAKFHLQYISIWIMLHFNGHLDDYLKYKNLNENRYLTKAEFDFYFKDEEMLHETSIVNDIFDFFQNKHNMFDMKSYLEYIRFISNNYSFIAIEDDQKEIMIINEIKEIEERTSKPFYSFLNDIKIENLFGKIKTVLVKNALKAAFIDIDLNEQCIVLFVNYFSNKSYLLFDAIKAVKFIKKYSKYQVSCKGIIERISDKERICDSDLIEKNKVTLVDFYNIMHKEFNMTTYEAILLFLSSFYLKENHYKKTYEMDMKVFFKKYNIDVSMNKSKNSRKTKTIASNKRKKTDNSDDNDDDDNDDNDDDNEIKKTSQSTMKKKAEEANKIEKTKQIQRLKKKQELEALKIFHRFAYYIRLKSKDNLESFFKTYDLNHNGHISRDELLNILSLFPEINDNDRMIILNYTDQHNMDDIQIQKFINIITSIKFDDEEYAALQNNITKEKHKFKSKINLNLLQTNILTNKNIIKKSNIDPLSNSIYYLQEHLINTYNTKDSIEHDMFLIANETNDPTSIPFNDFSMLIKGILLEYGKIDDKNIDKLNDFAFEGEKSNAKIKRLKENKLLPYNRFITNIVEYKMKPLTNKEVHKKETATKKMIHNKMEQKFKQKNDEYTNFFKSHFLKEIDLNKPEDINKLKTILLETFCFKHMEIQDICDKDLYLFKKFLTNLSQVIDKEIQYEFKEEDYFRRPNGKRIMTIFTNERAALKKCDQLYRELPRNGLFFDRDFGSLPEAEDFNNNQGKSSIYYHMNPPGQINANMIGWYHLNEIASDPYFLCKDFEQSDVVQGALGDCWFISGLASVKTKDHLMRGEFNQKILDDGVIEDEECVMLSSGVYPPLFHYFRRKGIYCFRFYKNFQWIYVVVDDRLPCMKKYNKAQKPKLIFGKCSISHEFWVGLIEKAYAKLHGCYEALVSGCIDDAIMDLTGQVNKRIALNLLISNNSENNDITWNMISNYNKISMGRKLSKSKTIFEKQIESIILSKNNSVLSCAVESLTDHQEILINEQKSGLLVNHGYTILNTFEIPKSRPDANQRQTSRLLRINNPWGFKIWNGKWGLQSAEFEKNKTILSQELYKFDPNAEITDPSTFIICFSDFRKIFTKIFMGLQLYPQCIGFYYEEMWTIDPPKGLPFSSNEHFSNNPQYYIDVRNTITLFAEIMQDDPRMLSSADVTFPFKDYIRKTCLVVLKTTGKQRITEFKKEDLVIMTSVRLHKDNSIHVQLKPGEYLLIPCNCDTGEEGKFRLVFYVRDTFKTEQKVDENDFIDKFNNFSIDKLVNEKESAKHPKPQLIKENSISSLKETKEDKMKIIYYQLHQALIAND